MRSTKLSKLLTFLTFACFIYFPGQGFTQVEESQVTQKKKDAAAWTRAINRLNQLEAKVREDRAALQSFIEMKKRLTASSKNAGSSEEMANVLNEIVTAHRSLQDSIDRYNSERKDLRYKFPGEGDIIERRYMPLGQRSIEQVEREVGLDGELTVLYRAIEKHYGHYAKPQVVAPRLTPPAMRSPAASMQDEKSPSRLRLVK